VKPFSSEARSMLTRNRRFYASAACHIIPALLETDPSGQSSPWSQL
jgi:hypothetical protein